MALMGASPAAEAKPTGWTSKSELSGSIVDAWAGYNEFGYTGRPEKKARTKVGTKATGKSARRASAHKRALRKAIKEQGYANAPKPEKGPKLVALTDMIPDVKPPAESITGGGIKWIASAACLNGTLASLVSQVAASYGSVTVNSTCRSRRHNARVGGARRSQHLTGDAVDFRVHGSVREVYAFLRNNPAVGGFKHYGGGLFHIDTGPRRTW
jgi:hypothetical protein